MTSHRYAPLQLQNNKIFVPILWLEFIIKVFHLPFVTELCMTRVATGDFRTQTLGQFRGLTPSEQTQEHSGNSMKDVANKLLITVVEISWLKSVLTQNDAVNTK